MRNLKWGQAAGSPDVTGNPGFSPCIEVLSCASDLIFIVWLQELQPSWPCMLQAAGRRKVVRDVPPASASGSEQLLWLGSEFCSVAHPHPQGCLENVVVLVFV